MGWVARRDMEQAMKKSYGWIKPKRKQYKKALNISPHYLPNFLREISLGCQSCNFNYHPNWFEKRQSLHPEQCVNGNHLLPIAAPVKCPRCKYENWLPVPSNEKKGLVYTYIDEAYRWTKKKYNITNYTAVSLKNTHHTQAMDSWNQLKEKLVLSGYFNEGDHIHMTELKENSPKKIASFVQEVSNWLNCFQQATENSIRIYSSTSVFKKEPTDIWMKRNAFESFFIISQMESTSGGIQHSYQYEKDGKQGWIKGIMLELSHTLMFPFISNGIPLIEPVDISKGAGLTELADIVAFSVARDYMDAINQAEMLIDSSVFGKIHYIHNDTKGSNKQFQKGIPSFLLK